MEIKHFAEIEIRLRFIRRKLLELAENGAAAASCQCAIFTRILRINLLAAQRDVLTMRFPSRDPEYSRGL